MLEVSNVRNFEISGEIVHLPGDDATIAMQAMGRQVIQLCRLDSPRFVTERGPEKASYKLVSLDLIREVSSGDQICEEEILGEEVEFLTEYEARPFLRAVASGGHLFEVDLV